MDPEELLDQVRTAVIEFSRSDTFADDLTCVVIKIADNKEVVSMAHSELEIASELSELVEARGFVRKFYQQYGNFEVDEEGVWQLELAVNEAVSNIIKHAYIGRKDQTIQIEADAFADRFIVTIFHWGKAFDPPESVPLPTLDYSRERGLGLFLINNCVDEVNYSRDNSGKNSIRLVKNLKRP
jgi:serine/threonine-protein kinase RsbW